MIADENRLKGTSDFDRVKKKGKLYQENNFGVSVYFRDDQDPPRFGFVVSNKISKHSTLRNRVKRAMRESARRGVTYVGNGYDMVFLAKVSIAKVSTEQIMREVEIFLRSGRYKE